MPLITFSEVYCSQADSSAPHRDEESARKAIEDQYHKWEENALVAGHTEICISLSIAELGFMGRITLAVSYKKGWEFDGEPVTPATSRGRGAIP